MPNQHSGPISSGNLPKMRQALDQIIASLGLELPPRCAEGLLAYCLLLQRWNATYNLTSVREPLPMLTQHIADCLAVVAPLRRELARHTSRRVLDAGSGGGLPGAVIAATSSDIDVVCVDSVGKKAAFVRQVAAELGLSNLHAEHARVESMPPCAADIVTSRAFATLADFVDATKTHVGRSGVWMAMKGKRPEIELAGLPEAVELFHVEHLSVPSMTAERCLVWMRRPQQNA